ncbi:MAG: MerR family transcriptional regulator [Capsulimonas sp.]|nr:MerR family transcriptional regulator [Capsulimonas sp.]
MNETAVLDTSVRSAVVSHDDLTVQQVVEMTGLSEHTLRYYERLGLIQPVRRHHSSGHRRYSSEDLARLETLSCLRATGMPLAEMRQYFEALADGAHAAARQRALLADHKAVLQERLRQMQRNLEYLDLKISYWDAVEARDDEAAAAITASYRDWLKSDTPSEPFPENIDLSKLRNKETL